MSARDMETLRTIGRLDKRIRLYIAVALWAYTNRRKCVSAVVTRHGKWLTRGYTMMTVVKACKEEIPV